MHVLSLPPAFVLSQDQTLKLRHLIQQESHSHVPPPKRPDADEDTLSASLRSGPSSRDVSAVVLLTPEGIRRDNAAHVSLSSHSLVKEPGAQWRRGGQCPPKEAKSRPRPDLSGHPGFAFRGADRSVAIASVGVAPSVMGIYGPVPEVSTTDSQKLHKARRRGVENRIKSRKELAESGGGARVLAEAGRRRDPFNAPEPLAKSGAAKCAGAPLPARGNPAASPRDDLPSFRRPPPSLMKVAFRVCVS